MLGSAWMNRAAFEFGFRVAEVREHRGWGVPFLGSPPTPVAVYSWTLDFGGQTLGGTSPDRPTACLELVRAAVKWIPTQPQEPPPPPDVDAHARGVAEILSRLKTEIEASAPRAPRDEAPRPKAVVKSCGRCDRVLDDGHTREACFWSSERLAAAEPFRSDRPPRYDAMPSDAERHLDPDEFESPGDFSSFSEEPGPFGDDWFEFVSREWNMRGGAIRSMRANRERRGWMDSLGAA